MVRTWLFLTFTCLNILGTCQVHLDGQVLTSLRTFLNAHNYQVYVSSNISDNIAAYKHLMRVTMTKFSDKIFPGQIDSESFMIDATDDEETFRQIGEGQFGRRFPSILIFGDENEMVEKMQNINIDQQVYGFVLDTLSIHEVYTVNGVKVTAKLAEYKNETNEFESFASFPQGFSDRRSNFHGKHFKTFVCTQAPYLFIEPLKDGEKAEFEYFDEHLTLEIIKPERISGIFRDLQIVMERQLNFSSTYYNCHNRGWGSLLPNGSYTGMIGSLHQGYLDLISTSLTLKPSRLGGVSFLYPVGLETYILLLPSIRSEIYDWSVFLDPFRLDTWTILLLNALTCTFLLWWLIWTARGSTNSLNNLISFLAFNFANYFSRPPPSEATKEGRAYVKWCVFIVSLCGTFIWSMYRASLTSHLSVRTTSMPFHDMESFLRSDYQLIFMGGGAIEAMFRHSPMESVHRRVFEKNFDSQKKEDKYIRHNEFDTLTRFLSLEFPQSSLWFSTEAISSYKQYWCQFAIPYVSKYPVHLSLATPKTSPFHPFLNRFVYKQLEQGSLAKINSRWKKDPPKSCLQSKGRALGKEKTVLLFAVWGFGCVFSVFLLVMEHCTPKVTPVKTDKARQDSNVTYGRDTLFIKSTHKHVESILNELKTSSMNENEVSKAIGGLQGILDTLRRRRTFMH